MPGGQVGPGQSRQLELRVTRLEQVLASLDDCAGGPEFATAIPEPLRLAIRDFKLELTATRRRLGIATP
jgi:hypothetical protein